MSQPIKPFIVYLETGQVYRLTGLKEGQTIVLRWAGR
jgi:hypothetical protein